MKLHGKIITHSPKDFTHMTYFSDTIFTPPVNSWVLPWSVQPVMTEYYRMDDLNNKHLFCTAIEARNLMLAPQRDWVLGEGPLSGLWRIVFLLYPHVAEKHSSLLCTNLIYGCSTLATNYQLKVPSCNTITFGVKVSPSEFGLWKTQSLSSQTSANVITV
jgi:hypothetical protein